MATFPTGIWTPPTRGTNLGDATTHTDFHDAEVAEIVAMQTALGSNLANVQAAAATSITATGVGASIGSGSFAVRIPIPSGGSLVIVNFTVQNNKGSNLAGTDDLATIPSGFRPGANQSNVPAHVLNTNALALVSISTAGLVEYSSGTVATGNFIRVQATYRT